MGLVSKIVGLTANKVAKYTGKAIKYTKSYSGIPVTHYVKTGTEVLNGSGVKSITLGAGNKLSQYFKQIVSYPKGYLGNDASRTIVLFGEKNNPIFAGAPKELNGFVKDWKELVDALKQSA